MNHNKTRIILCGKAASGKDHMRSRLEAKGFKYGISYTTRPRRPNEIDGVDYHFLSLPVFKALIERKFFYEHVEFNEWLYGTSREQWYETDDVFIMTPSGISKIHEEDRQNSFIIYFDMPIEVRKKRLKERDDNNDTIERRLEADEQDFSNFTDFDIKINNPDF